MERVKVVIPVALDRPFTYGVPEGVFVKRGDIVRVPFQRRHVLGIVSGIDTDYTGPVSNVQKIIHRMNVQNLDFVEWVARYTLNPVGMVAKMLLSGLPDKEIILPDEKPWEFTTVDLRPEQQQAYASIAETFGTFHPFLLEGVTGSGKTEVYFQLIDHVLKTQQQALVLLPEIALTDQVLKRFAQRFGQAPWVWHSQLTPKKRAEVWHLVSSQRPGVVVGARSGLFLPYQNLGLIIVDEEHDGTYKQEEQVLYHARDMAVVRANLAKCPIVLATATPSLETKVNVMQGRYDHVQLADRHGGASLPGISVVDMRQQPKGWVSPVLLDALKETLAKGQQSMLFLNRRGYAPLTLCQQCGYRLMCPGCAAYLVEHKRTGQYHCHHCDYHQPPLSHCPECQAEGSWIPCGPGVERLEEALEKLLPEARRLVLTSDSLSTPKKIDEAFGLIRQHEVDLIIGTQVLAKGHHFPLITLVGVIDADLGLYGGDLRGGERTFQLLHQVSGRAGREHLAGRVLIQTFNPESPVLKALQTGDQESFLTYEASARELAQMPPFGRLASVLVSGLNDGDTERVARQLARLIPQTDHIHVLGPVPATFSRLRGRYRWRFLVKAPKQANIQGFLKAWLGSFQTKGAIRITTDIDPYRFF